MKPLTGGCMQRCQRLLLFLALFQGMIYAQFSSAIQGVVTDNSGAAVPGATVKVANNDTGIVRAVETLNDGLFRVLSLGPGVYKISVQKPGFAEEISGFRRAGDRTDAARGFQSSRQCAGGTDQCRGTDRSGQYRAGKHFGTDQPDRVERNSVEWQQRLQPAGVAGRDGGAQPVVGQRRWWTLGQRSVLRARPDPRFTPMDSGRKPTASPWMAAASTRR